MSNVLSQNPVAGTLVAVGSAVDLIVQAEPPEPPIPSPAHMHINRTANGRLDHGFGVNWVDGEDLWVALRLRHYNDSESNVMALSYGTNNSIMLRVKRTGNTLRLTRVADSAADIYVDIPLLHPVTGEPVDWYDLYGHTAITSNLLDMEVRAVDGSVIWQEQLSSGRPATRYLGLLGAYNERSGGNLGWTLSTYIDCAGLSIYDSARQLIESYSVVESSAAGQAAFQNDEDGSMLYYGGGVAPNSALTQYCQYVPEDVQE